jgi:pimeloyl-ACP methyl ester carboxylesterase
MQRSVRCAPMLHHEETGSGEPLVLVHGAWADGRHLTRLAEELDGFQVVTYDRRGHGRSGGRHEGIARDVQDIVDMVEWLGTPAHVVGGSFGGSIALRLSAAHPDLLLSLSVHEPALPGLLGGAPGGGRQSEVIPDPKEFAESSLGEGAWDTLSEDERDGFRDNGEAYRDEMADADGFTIDSATLAAFDRPAMISTGTESPPFFGEIAEALAGALPRARIETVEGAGHLPHLTHPRAYAELVKSFASAAAAPR